MPACPAHDDATHPIIRLQLGEGRPEGAISADGRITGSYLHGLFSSDAFRGVYLARLGVAASGHAHAATLEATLEALADHVEAHLDVPGLLGLAR